MKAFYRTQRVDRWRLGWNHAETPSPGGLVDHVLNRGVARLALFARMPTIPDKSFARRGSR